MAHVSIILLAAGSSSRMGQSKQLLLIDDEPLLVRSVKAAVATSIENIVVVLGANEKEHQSVIKHLPIKIIHNKNWQSGMGSSLKVGLKHTLTIQPDVQAVIVMVCDQPLLTFSHLNKIIESYRQTKNSVASYYSDTPGVPALFDKTLFSELLDLPDDQGAKKIINKYKTEIELVDFPDGKIDLDTWEEYQHFKKSHS
jgi:molybdenum cofactor cytidylyltransferase